MTDQQQGASGSGQPWSRPAGAAPVGTSWPTQAPIPAAVAPRDPRRTQLIALGVGALGLSLLLGMGIGVAGSSDQPGLHELTQQLSLMERQAADSEQVVSDARSEADTEVSRAHADALAQVTTENAARQAELDARSAELDGRETGLAQREEAVKVLEQQAADGSLPGDGVYLVGSEVAPGTYRASSPEDCYWERRSGLSGDFSDMITNGLGVGDATVTIRASDIAFSATRCGTWSRIN